MLNLLRFVVIVVTGLVVFGWSLVAGQTPRPLPRPFDSFAFDPPVSQADFGEHWLTRKALPSPTTIRRPTFAVRNVSLSPAWLEFAPASSVERKSASWAVAKPIAAAALRPIETETPLSSHVVALTQTTVVDLRELSQRIASHNLSVQAIEDRLQQQQYWDLADLESTVLKIRDLLKAKDLWVLYYRVLDSRERQGLGLIASLTDSIELLRQRLFEAQVAADVDHTTLSRFSKEETRRRLSVLNKQTREWPELAD